MRKTFTAFALSGAVLLFTGGAAADELSDGLLAMCKAGDPKPETCECQVKGMVESVDARALKVLVASMSLPETASAADREKALKDALAATGLTQEEYEKLMQEGMTKAQPVMEACSA